MSRNTETRTLLFRTLTALLATLFVFALFCGEKAYALDEGLVASEYNGWLENDNLLLYSVSEHGFDGSLKYISDKENGCFYIYFSFFDTRLQSDEIDDDKIVISFRIENDNGGYSFSVNRTGLTDTADKDKVKLASRFDCSCDKLGGEILVGFELKSKTDKTLTNRVSCEYAAGTEYVTTLIDSAVLDMYKEPTTKTSSAKKNNSAGKDTTSKTEKAKTTKVTQTQNATKFKGSKSIVAQSSPAEKATESQATAEEATEASELPTEMSFSSKCIIALAGIFAAAGTIILTVCVTEFAVKKKLSPNHTEADDCDTKPKKES